MQTTITRHTAPVRIQTPISATGPRITGGTVAQIRPGANAIVQTAGAIQSTPPALHPVSSTPTQTVFSPAAQVNNKYFSGHLCKWVVKNLNFIRRKSNLTVINLEWVRNRFFLYPNLIFLLIELNNFPPNLYFSLPKFNFLLTIFFYIQIRYFTDYFSLIKFHFCWPI